MNDEVQYEAGQKHVKQFCQQRVEEGRQYVNLQGLGGFRRCETGDAGGEGVSARLEVVQHYAAVACGIAEPYAFSPERVIVTGRTQAGIAGRTEVYVYGGRLALVDFDSVGHDGRFAFFQELYITGSSFDVDPLYVHIGVYDGLCQFFGIKGHQSVV